MSLLLDRKANVEHRYDDLLVGVVVCGVGVGVVVVVAVHSAHPGMLPGEA